MVATPVSSSRTCTLQVPRPIECLVWLHSTAPVGSRCYNDNDWSYNLHLSHLLWLQQVCQWRRQHQGICTVHAGRRANTDWHHMHWCGLFQSVVCNVFREEESLTTWLLIGLFSAVFSFSSSLAVFSILWAMMGILQVCFTAAWIQLSDYVLRYDIITL